MDEQLMWDAEMAANKAEMLAEEIRAMEEYDSCWGNHGDWDYSYRDWA